MSLYKILVCDDEKRIREVIKEYAEFEGYKVFEAKDGTEAIELVKSGDFDALVLASIVRQTRADI